MAKSPSEMSRGELVTAGATVRHESPFSGLPVPAPPAHDVEIPEWAGRAFRVGLFRPGTIASLRSGAIMSVDLAFARELLTVFNWRHRMLGAYLAAIREFQSLESLIGTLLLRSDVCFAGQAYCLALAHFNSARSVAYLREYLEHYLTRPDLQFQQADALAALVCLDRVNHTSHASDFDASWSAYAMPESAVTGLAQKVEDYTVMLAALNASAAPAPSI